MTYLSPLLITIRSTEDGYYRWALHDGPDDAFFFSGSSPLLERCFEEILRARRALGEYLTNDLDPTPDPMTAIQLELPLYPDTPDNHPSPPPVPAPEQDIPSFTHTFTPTSLYPSTSRFG